MAQRDGSGPSVWIFGCFDNDQSLTSRFVRTNLCAQALQCLFESDFDLPQAVELLHAARYKRRKAQRNQTEKLDPESFRAALEMYGKKFHLVKVRMFRIGY